MSRWRGAAANLLAALCVAAAPAPADAIDRIDMPLRAIDPGQPLVRDPYRVVDAFLEAVDRGELVVFGHVIGREMLTPTQVDHAYDLATRTTVLRIHAELREPIELPGAAGYRIRCISAEMKDGRIGEVESHVWLDE
jgi:hypothetical protein